MQQTRRYLGTWELGCIVFHLGISKMLTSYPQSMIENSGSAGWVTVIFTGIVYFVVLFLAEKFLPKGDWEKTSWWKIFCAIAVVYWVFSAIYVWQEATAVLKQASYARSPNWFLMLFLLVGALALVLCGARAVFRMHSLLVLPIGIAAILIAFFGLRDAKLYNLVPFLGNGAGAVFGRGLSSLFLYADIPFLAVLLPKCRPNVSVKQTVFIASAFAVAVNVLLMLMVSATQPYEAEIFYGVPLYALSKIGIGLEAVYIITQVSSAMLVLGLALYAIGQGVKGCKAIVRKRQIAACLLGVLGCGLLSGCYDSREVEESAYLIALGVDQGQESTYRYTFQISNPLEMGQTSGDSGMEEKSAEGGKQEEGNKGVNNMTVEDTEFYLALSKLRSYLGKEPDLSHTKVVVFSQELAEKGVEEQVSLLLNQGEIPPNTKLCLAESAEEFLTTVKPSLEESTARYYELTFRQRYSPYAPVTELKRFVSEVKDTGKDPVLPIANGEQVSGMGIFAGDRMIVKQDEKGVSAYKLLSGQAASITVRGGESVFSVTCRKPPKIKVQMQGDTPQIQVETSLRASLLSGKMSDATRLEQELDEQMTWFLRECAANSADILGVGAVLRKQYPTRMEWEKIPWKQQLQKASITAKTRLKMEESTFNLQKD